MNITRCPSCLKPNHTEFCIPCRKKLFGGKRISPILPFSRPEYNYRRASQGERISISGIQSKYSLKLKGTSLELTECDGEYILKPSITGDFVNMSDMPSNEHVTMQLAKQVFGLHTAENALVFFRDDDTPAYLTKRFDVKPDGSKLLQEDFAQIAQVSEESGGKSYKYDYSYEKIASLMKIHVSTYPVELEKFFKIIVFNYLIHNGDAHLKNFSLYFNEVIDSYTLTPAYDLLNTRLHLPHESELALDLFEGGFESECYQKNGYYAYDDFYEFGIRIGMLPVRIERFMSEFFNKADKMKALIDISFIDAPLKSLYTAMVDERIKALCYSYRKSVTKN